MSHVRHAFVFDEVEVVVFGHFGKVSILLEDGQRLAEEIQRLVAYQLAIKMKRISLKWKFVSQPSQKSPETPRESQRLPENRRESQRIAENRRESLQRIGVAVDVASHRILG